MRDLMNVVGHGLALVFAVSFIRALPWSLYATRVKPLNCNPCMTGWVFLVELWTRYSFHRPFSIHVILMDVAAAGLALILLPHVATTSETTLTPPG